MQCELTLLAGFGAVVNGDGVPAAAWRHKRALQLVKILALAPGHRLMNEQVVDLLWPDLSASAGSANLRKAAHFARQALGVPDAVTLADGRIELTRADLRIDADEFERAVDVALRTRDPLALASSIGLYAGDLLPEDRYEEWAMGPRDRLRRKYLEALSLAGAWERLVEEEPSDEEAHRGLMLASLERGNRHAAFRQFMTLQHILARDLGVAPSNETLQLWAGIKSAAPPVPVAGPLVGRDDELELALSRWTQARDGQGAVLLVSGEAGIGKTRFCDELVDVARNDGAAVIHGSAHEEEAAAPFSVVFRALDAALLQRPELATMLGSEARRRVTDSAVVGATGLAWVEGSAPGIEKQRLLSSIAQLVTTAAHDSGLLLVVEDIHNADEGSLQLLTYLGAVSAREPLLLVLSHRTDSATPALTALRARLLQDRSTADIRLPRLDRQAVNSLVSHHAEATPEAAVDEIWRLAEGNPFYTEELASSFTSGGVVRVPDRVYEVIWARLDRLDTGVRHALRQLAVGGDTFTAEEFAAVLGGDALAAYDCLDQALQTGVIDERGASCQFRHALIRKALERSLPRHRRRQIHAETAARLAEAGTNPARVAYHLVQADQKDAAVPWLERAALEAAALGAYSDGLRLTTDAAAWARSDDRARLLGLRADMLFATGDPAASSAYDAALATAQPQARPRLWTMKARVLLATGSSEEAARALEWAEPASGPDWIAKLVVTGLVAWAGGDVDAAEQAARQARDRALAEGHLAGLGEATELLGLVAHSRGEWRERVRYELTDSLKRPEEVAGTVFDAHLCLAEYVLYGQQPYDQVIDFASQLRDTAIRAGARRGEAFATCILGEAEMLAGRFREAEEHLAGAAILHEAVDATAGQSLSLQRLAEVVLAGGDPTRATRLLDEAERVAQGSNLERHLLGKVYGTRVRAAADPAAAMSIVQQGEARMADVPVCKPCSIGFYVAASMAASRAADVTLAMDYLVKAEQVCASWSGGAWHAAVLECRGALAAAQGRPDDAMSLFGQAATSFDRAGQPPDSERCRVAAAG